MVLRGVRNFPSGPFTPLPTQGKKKKRKKEEGRREKKRENRAARQCRRRAIRPAFSDTRSQVWSFCFHRKRKKRKGG